MAFKYQELAPTGIFYSRPLPSSDGNGLGESFSFSDLLGILAMHESNALRWLQNYLRREILGALPPEKQRLLERRLERGLERGKKIAVKNWRALIAASAPANRAELRRELEATVLARALSEKMLPKIRAAFVEELAKNLSVEKKRDLTRALSDLERAADAAELLTAILNLRLLLSSIDRVERAVQAAVPGAKRYRRVLLSDVHGTERERAETFVNAGYSIGVLSERFQAREFERAAYTGGKVLPGASGGGKNPEKAAKAAARRARIVSEFEKSGLSQRRFEQLKKVPRKTLQRALDAAKENGVTPRQVTPARAI